MRSPSGFPRYACVLLLAVALPLSAATFTVTNTNDSGPGSLRQGLQGASTGAYDRIEFAIGNGPQTIQPLTPLPGAGAVVIDGTTQPGYVDTPVIEIDGSLVAQSDARGLEVGGEVRALVINNFSGPAIRTYSAWTVPPLVIRSCYLGTDLTGTAARPNAYGALIHGKATIGGSTPTDGNLISGNPTGVYVSTYEQVTIQGNTFGSDVGQTVGLPGTGRHIAVLYSANAKVFIGGAAANVFLGGSTAVSVDSSSGVDIRQNYIGITPGGKLIPATIGVSLRETSENVVFANVIAGAQVAGIQITGHSLRNKILGNSMEKNAFGIDLAGYPYYGPTPNDVGDSDTGPNNYLNFPVLGRVLHQSSQTVIPGTLSTAPNRAHRIELFSSASCNASGYGEGKVLIDAFELTTDANGGASFSRTLPAIPAGTIITATATSDLEGTSELSRCATVEGPGTFNFKHVAQSVAEGDRVTVTVNRDNGAAGTASVTYAVSGGTATSADFTGIAGTLAFADGETSKSFELQTTADTLYEDNETIILSLSAPTNGATIGAASADTLTIDDDDPPPLITFHSIEVAEGNSGTKTAEVRITLAAPAAAPYTISYGTWANTASAGTDFVATSGNVTFAAGETEKRVLVTIIGDTKYELNETFWLENRSSYGAAVITIVNDDPKPVLAAQSLEVAEGDVPHEVLVTVSASEPITGEVLVTLVGRTAQVSSDFAMHTAYVYFSNQSSKTVAITILGDTETEPNERFEVQLHYWWGNFGVGPNGVVTILNDDVGVGPAERWIAAGASSSYTVQRGVPAVEDVTIALTGNAPDAVALPASVVIPAGQSSADFVVSALQAGVTADITVTFPASLGGETKTVRAHTYAPATLRFSPSRVTVFDGETATVTVSLDPASTSATIIGLRSTDRIQVPSSMTIPPGGSATFVVTARKTGGFAIDAQLPPANGNEVQSLFGDVTVRPRTPTILDITPSHGPTAGGTRVTIAGANLRAGCAVAFGGVSATSVQFENTSTMQATTPPHAGGSVDVLLTCDADSFTFRDGFGYVAESPRVSTVTPSAGTTSGGTHVRVNGSHFDGSCWLFFGRFAATNVVVRDAESITGVSPVHAPGASDVTVRCSGGTSTAPLAYTYRNEEDPAPLLTSIDPAAAAPGEPVTIRGLHFRPSDNAAFDATPAPIADAAPESHVVAVPELPAGSVSVFVTDAFGRMTTSGPLFSVLEASPPRITAVTPVSVAPGGELELTGEGFRTGYSFEIGGHVATIVTSGYTRATVRVSSDVAPGSYPVQVRNRAGTLAAIGPAVEILDSGVVVTSVDPRCTTTDGGVYATIRGRGFTPDATVSFAGVPSPLVSFVDETTLRVVVPPGNAGTARIAVSTGRTASLTNGFSYASPFDPRGCSGRARSVRH